MSPLTLWQSCPPSSAVVSEQLCPLTSEQLGREMCWQWSYHEPGTFAPSAWALPVHRLLRAAAAGLLGAVGSAAVRNVDAGRKSGPRASRASYRPGPCSEVLAGAGRGSRGSGRTVCMIPQTPGVSPANVTAVTVGRAGGQVRAGVGSGPSVCSWISGRAALLCPHVNLPWLGCEILTRLSMSHCGTVRQIYARGKWLSRTDAPGDHRSTIKSLRSHRHRGYAS